MANAGPLADRLLIRELYGLYGDASCRGDREAWNACFTEDGEWNSHMFACAGAAARRAEWDKLWADWDEVAFWGEIGWIRVAGDHATARSYAREIVKLKAGGLFKLFGSYDDEMVRRDGAWLFTRRTYAPMILETPD